MLKAQYIVSQLGLHEKNVIATLKLLEEGATVPFISRYRKEVTGALDEVEITDIRDLSKKYDTLTQRKEFILKAIEEQEQLDDTLRETILNCFDFTELEDIYLPYKKKRRTRAESARELGLEGLAKIIMSQGDGNPNNTAQKFVKGKVKDVEMAFSGARDIIAEWINENASVRSKLRKSFLQHSTLTAKVVKAKIKEAEKYQNYFDFSGSLSRCPSHRFLAIYRAHNEGFLRMKINVDEDYILNFLNRVYIQKPTSPYCQQIVLAYEDSFKRLLKPALENEAIQHKKEEADREAISVFSDNLRQLFLSPTLGKKRVLAIDPGFRTGCKIVCLDESGDFLTNVTIYPHAPQNKMALAKSKVAQLVEAYHIDAIAIGDGTASRETERMIKSTRFKNDVEVYVVPEDGASIYSASPIARQEFPMYDVTVRGAISIGRRLIDPLAELVKIDPKSIGVGQYQHEVNQKLLKDELNDVVISCVNEVGVNLNSASSYLLSYVSGLGPQLAENIISYRQEKGGFQSRSELKNVARLGDKAFEQSAGFLRIVDGKNSLDNSAVHPESYPHVIKMSKQLNLSIEELLGNTALLNSLKQENFNFIDPYTFTDIIKELQKPGRDPRGNTKVLEFSKDIKVIEDLKVGMELNGIVTNITNFGAFVNIGIKENGLIHKSSLSEAFVENVSDFIRLHEHITVVVIQLDIERKRIGLAKSK